MKNKEEKKPYELEYHNEPILFVVIMYFVMVGIVTVAGFIYLLYLIIFEGNIKSKIIFLGIPIGLFLLGLIKHYFTVLRDKFKGK